MFRSIAWFELRYQLKNPVFWLSSALFFLFAFASVAVDQIHVGDTANVHRNAPVVLAHKHYIFSIFYMFIAAAFVADVVVRDDETGFGPLVRSTAVRKFDYLYGRFAGSLGAAALAFAAVPLGLAVGAAMPWLDPDTVGPFRLADYLYAYFALGLPSLLLTAATFFALATATRSMMATYVGAVAFLVLWIVTHELTGQLQFERASALLDPFGLSAYTLATKYFTPVEQNTLRAPLVGYLLWNRVLWTAVTGALLALAYRLYRFEERGARAVSAKRLATPPPAPAPACPAARPVFGARTALAQLGLRTRLELRQVLISPAFFVMLALGIVNASGALWHADSYYGGEIYPVTRVMIRTLGSSFTFMPFLVAIYYAGEIVWRERAQRVAEIVDATPVPDALLALPKFLGAALIIGVMILASVAAALLVQVSKGYTHLELGKYILWYVVPKSIDLTLVAVLALFIQTLAPNKLAGWGLMVAWFIGGLTLDYAGFEHNLYHFGLGPEVPLSDMNGQGRFAIHRDWFRAYWVSLATLLVLLSCLLWRRGGDARLRPRLARLPSRVRGLPAAIAVAALGCFVGTGIFIYINTNVWNAYRTRTSDERWTAEDEKILLPYEKEIEPRVVAVTLDVDLEPHTPKVTTRGTYRLMNRSGAPIERLHVRFDRDLDVVDLKAPGGHLERSYEAHHFRIFRLEPPLDPGQTTTLEFTTVLTERGFRNTGDLHNVVDNGTVVNNSDIAPKLGVDRSSWLKGRSTRRLYGLSPEAPPASLEDDAARSFTYVRRDSDWVDADITVHTDAAQTPLAPGYRVSDVTEGGRRTARFVTEAPILHYFSVQSAVYATRDELYKGVDLAIYYDARHPWNIERMLTAMKASLDYDQANFSPYQFRQARIVEFPDYVHTAQAFANTIPYSEGMGFIEDYRDPEKIDFVTYVTAHEIAHQWWAHQVIGADMQGASVLSETLAQYSALMVMQKLYGPDQIGRFLKYELDGYLRSRGGEVAEELPLLRVEEQDYIRYRKGSLVMYRLQNAIGAEAVNRALRRLLSTYAFQAAPYASSKDLLGFLRDEAATDQQALITDLFEKITLYDIKTTEATSSRREDGQFDVTLAVEAKKMYADGHGAERVAPMDEDVEVGVFSAEPGKKGFQREHVLALEKRRLRSGKQWLRFVVPRAPAFAGADPYNMIIDRHSDDNIVAVTD